MVDARLMSHSPEGPLSSADHSIDVPGSRITCKVTGIQACTLLVRGETHMHTGTHTCKHKAPFFILPDAGCVHTCVCACIPSPCYTESEARVGHE